MQSSTQTPHDLLQRPPVSLRVEATDLTFTVVEYSCLLQQRPLVLVQCRLLQVEWKRGVIFLGRCVTLAKHTLKYVFTTLHHAPWLAMVLLHQLPALFSELTAMIGIADEACYALIQLVEIAALDQQIFNADDFLAARAIIVTVVSNVEFALIGLSTNSVIERSFINSSAPDRKDRKNVGRPKPVAAPT